MGFPYSNADCEKHLSENGITFEKPGNLAQKIAEAIAEGKVVAHFYGKSEYGPRALGNRSLLASPKDPSINKTLNNRLKRTEFMPFAPALMEEYASDFLKGWDKSNHAARFMTITYDVLEKMRSLAPAVVHIDGTARPQIVSQSEHPRFHAILKAHFELTGIPLLINTSFNLHEEPIVNTFEEATRIIRKGVVEILVLNDYWIEQQ